MMRGSMDIDRPELLLHEAALWRSAIAGRCGLDFGEGREKSLSRGLWGRAREVGVSSYAEYRRYLAADGREWQRLIERLVNHETRFWRHAPSFEYLTEVALPTLRRERAQRGDLRPIVLWSAGCSTGDEAYSLAMAGLAGAPVLAPGGKAPSSGAVRVLGTDLSEAAIERARAGRYAERSVASLPPGFARRFLIETKEAEGGDRRRPFAVRPEVRAVTSFWCASLVASGGEGVPAEPVDVIYCQNVLLYFQPEVRLDVVRRLARRLAPGGYLILAPGEIVGLRLPELEGPRSSSAAVYRRVSSSEAVRAAEES